MSCNRSAADFSKLRSGAEFEDCVPGRPEPAGALVGAEELAAAKEAAGGEPFVALNQGAFRLLAFDVVTSTNDAVKAALKTGAPEGFAVSARVQTRGYGRQGRTWVSPRGGIYVSLGLRPQVDVEQLPTLGLVASMAVRQACASLLGTDAGEALAIKWPNDLVVKELGIRDGQGADASASSSSMTGDSAAAGNSGGLAGSAGSQPSFQKLCGISFETCAGGACLGIGVNVYRPSEQVDVCGKNAPAYLEDLGYEGSVDQVAKAVLQAFEPLYRRWCECGFEPMSGEYAALNVLLGQEVRAVNHYTNAELAHGCVVGVDSAGRLLLRSPQGQINALSSGEVHLVG